MIELREWERTRLSVELTQRQARIIHDSRFVEISADFEQTGYWSVHALQHVGVRVIEDVEIRVHPKVPVNRLLQLLSEALGLAAWPDELTQFDEDHDLASAIAATMCALAEQIVRSGLLQGYRHHETSEFAVRGRIRFASQVSRQRGLALPVELEFDEFTTDVAENRLIAGALDQLQRLPGLPDALRLRVRRLGRDFSGVTPEGPSAHPSLPMFTRMNERYRSAVQIARLILRSDSITDRSGLVRGAGFSVDMNRLYETVVGNRLKSQLEEAGGRVSLQDVDYLDDGKTVQFRPDLVWYREGRPVLVADLKYKRPLVAGIKTDDIYQAVTYAVRLGLDECHLIYPTPVPAAALQIGDLRVRLHYVDIETQATSEADLDSLPESPGL